VGGLVYIQWGHTSFPRTETELVYSGRAAGPFYSSRGGGSNPQCLPLNPIYLKHHNGSQKDHSYIYGAEYERANPFVKKIDDGDVPYAACYVPMYSQGM